MDYAIKALKAANGAVRFSTDGIPRRDRAEAFRNYVKTQIVRFDYDMLAENNCIDGAGMKLPDLGVVAVNITPVRCTRTRETMQDGNDNIRLVILRQATSAAPAIHRGKDLTVDPGSAIVLSNCDFNAITFTAVRSRMISLNLARKRLRPLLQDFDAVLARPIPSQIGPLRLLTSYIEALLGDQGPPTPTLQQLSVNHIYDLAALVMGGTGDAIEIAKKRGLRAARLREIKSHVTANLWRDGLSVGEIAIRYGVTPRYVQVLFEDEGVTFTQFVRNARLDQAHRMLINPLMASRSVSTIAIEVGFSDLSYFNRTFRRRFSANPSDVRALARGIDKS